MAIKNYSTQTSSHRGYTIEELKRLFPDNKPITSENIRKLIEHCFNYELVSGEGTRILELKNNDFKSNTTKTYKIESYGEGGGGGGGTGGGFSKADYGVTIDQDDTEMVIADLYDYQRGGDISESGIYPVSLSETGQLIVDMSNPTINATASATAAYAIFKNEDLSNWFIFTVSKNSKKIQIQSIRTYVKEGNDIIGEYIYASDVDLQRINQYNETITYKRNCTARRHATVVDNQKIVNMNSATRTGWIEVVYTYKGSTLTKTASASTTFRHPVFIGYTCTYMTQRGGTAIYPDRWNPSLEDNPCFLIYSTDPTVYENPAADYHNRVRNDLTMSKTGSTYNIKVLNTDDRQEHSLGYYEQNEYALITGLFESSKVKVFNLDTPKIDTLVFSVILLPSSITGLSVKDRIGTGSWYEYTLFPEKIKIKDGSYNSSEEQWVEYIAYTSKDPFSASAVDTVQFELTVNSIQ